MIDFDQCPLCASSAEPFKDNYGKYATQCSGCGMLVGIELEDGVKFCDGWRATFDTLEDAKDAWNMRNEGTVL